MANHDTHDHSGVTGVPADASELSFDPTGLDNTDATDVQEAIADLDAAITAGGGGSGNLAGTELDYVAFTSPVSVTHTSEGSADTVVTGSSVAYDGSTIILVEFFCPAAEPQATASAALTFLLYDGGTILGYIAGVRNPASGNMRVPVNGSRRLTPSNGSHQYIVKAMTSSGTASAGAGGGGTGDYVNGYIRITRVSA